MTLDFLAGCAGGAAGVIVGHPLDTVKVRIQTQSPNNIKYRGTFQTLSMIVRQESVNGLYKGITSPLVGVAGVNAIVFGVYGLLRPFVAGSPGNDALWAHFVAGAISGSVQSVVCAPMELVKIRMQVNESAKATSSIDILKNIYRNEGGLFRGVYKGWLSTLYREIPGFGSYFATYELLTTKTGYEVGTLGMLFAGGMAGVVSWIFCFPMDVVKTRIQMDVDKKYSGILDCVKQTYKAEGYKPFVRGLNSSVIRAFPTNAATFSVVNWIMRLADQKQGDLQTGRQELAHLLEEWDRTRNQRKEIYNSMNWSRVPCYNYLSAQCLFPKSSSTIQLIDSNLKRMNSLFNVSRLSDSRTSCEILENIEAESHEPTETNLTKSNDSCAHTKSKQMNEFRQQETIKESSSSTFLPEMSHLFSKEHLTILNSLSLSEKETLVVSTRNGELVPSEMDADNNETEDCPTNLHNKGPSFRTILTRWLSNFTLTPVHFCQCVDNCTCSF